MDPTAAVPIVRITSPTSFTTTFSSSLLTLADLQGAMASLATASPLPSSSSSNTSLLQDLIHVDTIEESKI